MVHREQCVDFALQEPDVCVCVCGSSWREASAPHQNNYPHIRSIQSHRSFQTTAEATFIRAGPPGCVVSSPQACSGGESHTKSMSRVWPGYQGNQSPTVSPVFLQAAQHLYSMYSKDKCYYVLLSLLQ